MNKAISTLQKRATGRTVLVLFILTMAVYILMLMVTIPGVVDYAPGLELFDLSPAGYSYEQAVLLLETLGEEGRQVYLTWQLPADFIYPGLFAISYSLLLTWLFAKSFDYDHWIYYFMFVPLLGGLFDYLENIGIVLMISAFPDLSQGIVILSSTFTILKSSLTTLFFLLLFFGFGAWIISLIRTRQKQTNTS